MIKKLLLGLLIIIIGLVLFLSKNVIISLFYRKVNVNNIGEYPMSLDSIERYDKQYNDLKLRVIGYNDAIIGTRNGVLLDRCSTPIDLILFTFPQSKRDTNLGFGSSGSCNFRLIMDTYTIISLDTGRSLGQVINRKHVKVFELPGIYSVESKDSFIVRPDTWVDSRESWRIIEDEWIIESEIIDKYGGWDNSINNH